MRKNKIFLMTCTLIFCLLGCLSNCLGQDIIATSSWNDKDVAVATNKKGMLLFLTKEKEKWHKKASYNLGKDVRIRYVDLDNHGQVALGFEKNNEKFLKIFEIKSNSLLPIKSCNLKIFPDDIVFDKTSTGQPVRKKIIPEVSFSPHHSHFSISPAPCHVAIFDDKKSFLLRIYPLKEYEDMWANEEDFSIKIAIRRIKKYLSAPLENISPPLEILPPRAGLNDIAVFIEKIFFKNGKGLGFVGRITKDIACVSPNELKYFFVGITDDNKFLISFERSLKIKETVPNKLWNCKKRVAGLRAQIDMLSKELPELGKKIFEPDLLAINKFLSSLYVKDK